MKSRLDLPARVSHAVRCPTPCRELSMSSQCLSQEMLPKGSGVRCHAFICAAPTRKFGFALLHRASCVQKAFHRQILKDEKEKRRGVRGEVKGLASKRVRSVMEVPHCVCQLS